MYYIYILYYVKILYYRYTIDIQYAYRNDGSMDWLIWFDNTLPCREPDTGFSRYKAIPTVATASQMMPS